MNTSSTDVSVSLHSTIPVQQLLDGFTDEMDRATFGLLIFALGLSIPENQQQMCLDLTKSFWISTSLTNDYHSWERERKASTGNSHDFVTNAIWVLMNKHSMTCDEAKAVCRERAQRCAAEYIRVVKNSKTRDDLCRDAKFFLDVLQFGISGNIVWGVRSPRYHPDRELSLKQREMAISVWADENIGSATNGTVHQDTAVVRGVPRLGPEVCGFRPRNLAGS